VTLEADFSVARRKMAVEMSLAVEPGERLSLFGPSGAGKTTALEALAGLVPIESGEVRLDGVLVNVARPRQRDRRGAQRQSRRLKPVPARQCGVSIVRQPTTLFPHLSVGENASYGSLATSKEAEEMLRAVGLGDLHAASPGTLSGGQRQMLALARALARPFKALLLDEPVSAVDVRTRPQLMEIATATAAGNGAVAILVSHDLQEAQGFGQLMGLVDAGRVIQLAHPEKLAHNPATVRGAELLGYTAFIPRDAATAWAIHPDRCIEGSVPDKGLVLEGSVAGVRAAGVRFACDISLSSEQQIEIHTSSPPEVGTTCTVTALDPPLVGRVNR
jgi:molybdate transport system ATP-binding protein